MYDTKDNFIDGDAGSISDESDFFGDEITRSRLERRCKRRLESRYTPFANAATKRIKLDSKSTENDRQSVVEFLRTRPQIAKVEASSKQAREVPNKRTGQAVDLKEGAEFLQADPFQGHMASWQQNETIDAFLNRCPVNDPATAAVGPWLWVRCPQPSGSEKRLYTEKVPKFIETGQELLEAFLQLRSKVQSENPGKATSVITRKMKQYRDQLEDDILRAAVETSITCGKWMLFPNTADLPRHWRLVAEATAQGKLGPGAKVATPEPLSKDSTLICVYTHDFTDLDDVRGVLDQLIDLNLCAPDGKPIYYKCDAYTYLDIKSDNSYKLRASLFSSKEVLGNDPNVFKDGPIPRLKIAEKTNKSLSRS